MMSIFTKRNIKTCTSTTKVQNMCTKYSTKKTERHRINTNVHHAYNKDYHIYNIENMQGEIQSVCICMSVCL